MLAVITLKEPSSIVALDVSIVKTDDEVTEVYQMARIKYTNGVEMEVFISVLSITTMPAVFLEQSYTEAYCSSVLNFPQHLTSD
jgi:hypothetical protein